VIYFVIFVQNSHELAKPWIRQQDDKQTNWAL